MPPEPLLQRYNTRVSPTPLCLLLILTPLQKILDPPLMSTQIILNVLSSNSFNNNEINLGSRYYNLENFYGINIVTLYHNYNNIQAYSDCISIIFWST